MRSVAPAPLRAIRERGGDGAGSVRSGVAATVRTDMPGKMSEEEEVPNRSASLTFTIEHILSLKQRDASSGGWRRDGAARVDDRWDGRTGFDSAAEHTGEPTGEPDERH